ncbi:MAG: hypothetical protein ACJ731_12650, partial [Vicinamibacterales bacterium]
MTVPVVRFAYAGETQEDQLAESIGEPGRAYTVIYDGHCKVCGKMVRLLKKWDRHHELEIIPSLTPGLQAGFPWIPPR